LRALSDTNTAIYSVGFSSTKEHAKHEAARTFSDKTPGPPHGCMGKDPNADETQNKLSQAFDCLSLLAPPLRLAKVAAIASVDGLRRNVPETVAQLTGGEYVSFGDERSLVNGLVAFSNHLPNRYLLSYQPQSPHPGFHVIELRLREYPDLHISARTGYWADAGADSAVHP
jgi:hypothetical protein